MASALYKLTPLLFKADMPLTFPKAIPLLIIIQLAQRYLLEPIKTKIMKTNMDVSSLGEREGNYTNSSVRSTHQNKSLSKKSGGSGKVAAGLLAGAGFGVLAGMLLAPKTGRDMRRQVTESANKLGTQASNLYNTSREKVGSWTGKGKTSGSQNNITPKTDTTPNTNITPGRDVANDPATSITM